MGGAIANSFTYYYNEVIVNCLEELAKLEPKDFADVELVVPKRDSYEFDGWYLEWLFKTGMSDTQGGIVIDDQLYENDSRQICANRVECSKVKLGILQLFWYRAIACVELALRLFNGHDLQLDNLS